MKATNYLISGMAGGIIALIVCRRLGVFTTPKVVKPKAKSNKPKGSPKGSIPKPKPIKPMQSGVGDLKSKKALDMPPREDIKTLDVNNISQSDGVKEQTLTMADTTTKSGISKILRSGGLPPKETMGARPINKVEDFRQKRENGGIKNELEDSISSSFCDMLEQRYGRGTKVVYGRGTLIINGRKQRASMGIERSIDPKNKLCVKGFPN